MVTSAEKVIVRPADASAEVSEGWCQVLIGLLIGRALPDDGDLLQTSFQGIKLVLVEVLRTMLFLLYLHNTKLINGRLKICLLHQLLLQAHGTLVKIIMETTIILYSQHIKNFQEVIVLNIILKQRNDYSLLI